MYLSWAPLGSQVKHLPAKAGRMGSIPCVAPLGTRKWQPTSVLGWEIPWNTIVIGRPCPQVVKSLVCLSN